MTLTPAMFITLSKKNEKALRRREQKNRKLKNWEMIAWFPIRATIGEVGEICDEKAKIPDFRVCGAY